MRLINADVLICYLQTLQAVNSGDALFCKDLEDFIDHIEELPTAYDPDKVVEQLEMKVANCYNHLPVYGEKAVWMGDGFKKAIEIVKKGGNV